jgi:hypothetical protein
MLLREQIGFKKLCVRELRREFRLHKWVVIFKEEDYEPVLHIPIIL